MHGWLAEAQGLLMMSFPREVSEELSERAGDYAPQHQVKLDGRLFIITDVKTATYRASEGELPFPAPPQFQQRSVDLIDTKGGFATIEISSEGAEVYLGEFAEFDALKLTICAPCPVGARRLRRKRMPPPRSRVRFAERSSISAPPVNRCRLFAARVARSSIPRSPKCS